MSSFVGLLQQGDSWWFVPSAVLLGALHGLEPGHSKTMMAAFIIAIRGTVTQAVLLGLAATVSHTALVWLVALGGLYFGRQWSAETSAPYFQVASALLIIAVGLWMLVRTWRAASAGAVEDPHHRHSHDAQHAPAAGRRIDTAEGQVRLEIYETGTPPRFRLTWDGAGGWPADAAQVETERSDGSREVFNFRAHGDYLESVQTIPEPHEFVARLRLQYGGHTHDYDVEFVEQAHHHAIGAYAQLDAAAPGYHDPHELAHANDIRHRFADSQVTTGQIVMFGLTGGLIPCPASVTVLLLCLQLQKVSLGAILVLCFSIGLALTLVSVGAIAALGVRQASRRFAGFGMLARRAPYISGALIVLVGLYLGWQGVRGL